MTSLNRRCTDSFPSYTTPSLWRRNSSISTRRILL
ncbi:hypothetical protein E2C01_084017 [Portunus trituberculatus]|uniref:Uncharacterized protein n=1 Tax=Portunus trituberculatus TaxID=210409 RepID=A0A5B7J6C2_PORTR|nr:hypothetical protein [Portunus trituberculatus]